MSEPLPTQHSVPARDLDLAIRRSRSGVPSADVYTGFALALTAAIVLGFSRTFFLRHWFPVWATAHGAPEPIFYVHGMVFLAWFILLITQTSLSIAARRVHVHRRLGWVVALCCPPRRDDRDTRLADRSSPGQLALSTSRCRHSSSWSCHSRSWCCLPAS